MENLFPWTMTIILEDTGDFFYPIAQMFMRTFQMSSFVDVDMLR